MEALINFGYPQHNPSTRLSQWWLEILLTNVGEYFLLRDGTKEVETQCLGSTVIKLLCYLIRSSVSLKTIWDLLPQNFPRRIQNNPKSLSSPSWRSCLACFRNGFLEGQLSIWQQKGETKGGFCRLAILEYSTNNRTKYHRLLLTNPFTRSVEWPTNHTPATGPSSRCACAGHVGTSPANG